MLIEGPAGIGKTRLLAEFARHAARRRRAGARRARAASSSASSRSASSASSSRASRPASASARSRAPRPPRGACSASPDDGDAEAGDASFAVLHGLYWLALNLAAERPLLLARRRPALVRPPVAALPRLPRAPARGPAGPRRRHASGPASRRPTPRCWPRSPTIPPTAHVRPGAAQRGARSASSCATASAPSADRRSARPATAPPAATRCSLRQLMNALETDGVSPTPPHADVVREIGPRAVSRSVLLRLARLPGEAAAVARAVAVLGEGADLPAGRRARRARRGAGRRRDRRRSRGPRSCAPSRRSASCTRWCATPSTRACRSASASSCMPERRSCCATPAPRWTRSPAS